MSEDNADSDDDDPHSVDVQLEVSPVSFMSFAENVPEKSNFNFQEPKKLLPPTSVQAKTDQLASPTDKKQDEADGKTKTNWETTETTDEKGAKVISFNLVMDVGKVQKPPKTQDEDRVGDK